MTKQYRVLQRDPRVGDLVRVVDGEEGVSYKNGDIGTLLERDETLLQYRIQFEDDDTWVYAHEVEFIEEVPATERTYTTGEIIHTLQTRQRAHSHELDEYIYKHQDGSIRNTINHDWMPLMPAYINATWTIVPEYVKFDTAYRAWRNGKRVECDGFAYDSFDDDVMLRARDIESDKWIILD